MCFVSGVQSGPAQPKTEQGGIPVKHRRLIEAVILATLSAGLPAIAGAQDGPPNTPEGVDWTLTSYLDTETAEVISVPFGVTATLLLQDGAASGSAGCNQFNGSYQIEGTSLSFSEEMAVTLALCEDDVQAVEDAYLSSLGEVDGWMIDAEALELSNSFGDVILTFEVPDIAWTASQMSDLMTTLQGLRTQIDTLTTEAVTLREQLDGQNVVQLRKRIKALESDDRQLTKRLDTLAKAPKPTTKPTDAALAKWEQTLLKAVPKRIAKTCEPLRTSLPSGTQAALTCTPNTAAVGNLEYYLMEGEDAAAAYQVTMSDFNVPQATSTNKTCEEGSKSQRQWIGGDWEADGCFRSKGRAEVRFIDNATDCRKLKVSGTTLQSPTFYIGIQGKDDDIKRVYKWATKGLDPGSGQITSLTVPIERPNAAISPSCPQ